MTVYPRDYTSGTLGTYRVSTRLSTVPRVLLLPNLYSTYRLYDTYYSYRYKPEYRPSSYQYYRD